MKTSNIVKNAMLAVFMAAAHPAPASQAGVQPSANPIKIQPSAVYHAIQGKSLADTLTQVAQRSGITFKINTGLGKDLVTQSIAADDWNTAVRSLLADYNFTTIQERGTIKTVIISGRNNDAAADTDSAKTLTASVDDIIVIEPRLKTLPEKYRDFPAGSVTAVDLPVTAMMNVRDGSTVALDLPMGQFNVVHDHTVNEADGSKTWVGYLSNEGEGYRVFLSQGAAGTLGVVTTPDGTYSIESDKTGAYLVDTTKLQHAGFEGDSVLPSKTMMGAIAMQATQSQVDQLQTVVNAAKKVLDTANALVTQYTSQLNSYQTQLKTLQTAFIAATIGRDSAQNTYNVAYAAYRAKRTAANLAAVNNANAALSTAKNAYAAVLRAYQVMTNNVSATNSRLTAAKAAATKAQANYDQALKALNDAKAALVVPPPSGTTGGPVVDLMVLYTTAGQTADYAKQRITLLVTASNQAYVDSNIKMKLRLVYTEPTPYIDNNSNLQALYDLAGDRGAFAGIAQKRVQYGADLVFLFRPLYAQTAGSCGTTYVEFAQGGTANKSLGYGTIGDGSSKDALKNYYCAVNTFTHEIGHSLGLVHDRENSSFSGVFNYAYAWGVQGTFATIMSYKQPMLMYFSTPALATKCAGQPCGYAETDAARSSDQAKSVNYTAPIVANFMPTMLATPIIK
jgi:hypothetical protein